MAETQKQSNQGSSKEGSQQNIQRGDIQQRDAGSRGLARYGEWMTSPFSFMRRFSEEMDRLFEDFGFSGSPLSRSTGGVLPRQFGRGLWTPPVEVFTRENQLVVRAELPGIDKKDVKVECTDDSITIQGEKRQEQKEEHEGHFHTERSYGKFFRQIPLPEGAKPEDAKAVFRDGILEITMKAPQEAKSREIKIGD